jgi:hypothetical protein
LPKVGDLPVVLDLFPPFLSARLLTYILQTDCCGGYAALHVNKTLTTVELGQCSISDAGAAAFADGA